MDTERNNYIMKLLCFASFNLLHNLAPPTCITFKLTDYINGLGETMLTVYIMSIELLYIAIFKILSFYSNLCLN